MCVLAAMTCVLAVYAGGGKEETGARQVIVWHSNSGVLQQAFEHLVDEFNRQNSDIRITAVYQGKANDVLSKVKAASMSGTGLPDIAQLDATAGLDMIYSDYLVTTEELGMDTSSILPSALAAYDSMRGHIGVPFNASSLLFYYNKTAFDKAGVAVPGTLDEFTSNAATIKEKTGMSAFAGVPTTYELCTFLASQDGGQYISDRRNGHDGVSSKVLFDENGTFRNFLEKWKSLYDTGALDNLTSGVSDAFYSQQTASMLASSSNLTTALNNIGNNFELGVAFVPMVDENATGGVNIGGGFLAAFDTGKGNEDDIRRVIEYFISPEAQMYWARETGYIPVNSEVEESPEWQAFVNENPLFGVAFEQAVESSPMMLGLWIPSAYQVYYSFQSTIAEMLEGKRTIDDAVDYMAELINGYLAEYARQNGD